MMSIIFKNFNSFNSLPVRCLSLASAPLQQQNGASVEVAHHGHDDHGIGHGHHHVANHGPPLTFDYMAIPSQPYKKVYKELSRKFRVYLAMSLVFFAFSVYVGYVTDVLGYKAWKLPASYRNRKAINARLDAEEAKAKAEQVGQ
ncbi:hypothetical protein GPALN_005415 [Globodera pallida]|nr:hypothetical protein GPALN_005415 [Globodera pallida]